MFSHEIRTNSREKRILNKFIDYTFTLRLLKGQKSAHIEKCFMKKKPKNLALESF